MSKVKLYRNSERGKPEKITAYVPQYKSLEIEPQQVQSAQTALPLSRAVVIPAQPDLNNPRLPRSPMRQPYAETVTPPLGKGLVPNVGNNMEHTWSSLGIEDDLTEELDPGKQMVNNNDYVSDATLGLGNDINVYENERDTVQNMEKEITKSPDNIQDILFSLQDDDYILFIDGVALYSGALEDVQEEVRKLAWGTHEDFDTTIPIDSMTILKKIKIKVGIFLE